MRDTPPLALAALAGVGLAKACLLANTAQPFKTEEPPMNNIATTNEASAHQDNVTSLPSTPKPHTSKEVIAANIKLLIDQLKAGHSEGLTAYPPQWAVFIATPSATSSRSHGKIQMHPKLQGFMRGTSLDAM
jgi:hypothetical protein